MLVATVHIEVIIVMNIHVPNNTSTYFIKRETIRVAMINLQKHCQ